MLKQNKIAVAVTAALGVSLGATGTAQADWQTLFLPHIVKSATVTTVVSVINHGNVATEDDLLHYALYHKPLTGDQNGNLNSCEEINYFLSTSPNDIQTFDATGKFGQSTLGVLFNDPSIQNDWEGWNRSYSMIRNFPGAARGFLLVDNDGQDDDGSLAGEAFVFEWGTGAAWGYQGWANADSDVDEAFDYSGASSDIGDTNPLDSVPILPLDEFATAFMTTPVGGNQNNKHLINGIRFAGEMFDRDENPISGQATRYVRCVGRVDVQDLLEASAEAELQDGGWGSFAIVNGSNTAAAGAMGTANNTDLAVVYKLEYNLGAKFNGENIGGLYNNAFQYRDQNLGD
jgi:hypothetical protein